MVKSCPFCGKSKTSIECKSKNDFKGQYRTYSVRCNVCHARGSTVSGYVSKNLYCHQDVTITSAAELKAKAIELWNNRNQED